MPEKITNNNFRDLQSQLYSAVISDVLDGLGYRHQAMRPFIRPVRDDIKMIGRARTGRYVNVHSVDEGENPYEIEIELVDDLKAGEIAVLGCNGPTERIAPWGELLSTAAKQRNAVGCVTDGLIRDVVRIKEIGFCVFHGGIGPLDSSGRAKMIERELPVECGGVLVNSGDIVFGDLDGVVVIPQAIESDVINQSIQKVTAENNSREDLEKGLLLAEVYEKYGVL